jgi:hypothetical protein
MHMLGSYMAGTTLVLFCAMAGKAAEKHWDSEPTPMISLPGCWDRGSIALEANLLGSSCLLRLDTGAVHTTLHKHMRERFLAAGIVPSSKMGLIGAGGTPLAADVFPGRPINVANVELAASNSLICLSTSIRSARHDGRRIDGNLGMDILGQHRILIDYDRSTIKLWSTEPNGWTPPDWTSIPLEDFAKYGDIVTYGANATIENGIRIRFLLDTGNTTEVTASHETYRTLSEDARIVELGTDTVRGVGGQFTTKFGRLDTVHFGPYTHRSLEVTAARQDAIGLGYLCQFVCLFDFPARRLYLKPAKLFGRGNCFDLDGLVLPETNPLTMLLSSGLTVSGTRAGSPAEAVGIQAGDVLQSLGDFELRAYPLSSLYRYVRWQEAEKFELRVARGKETLTFELPVTMGLATIHRDSQVELCNGMPLNGRAIQGSLRRPSCQYARKRKTAVRRQHIRMCAPRPFHF